MTMRAVPAGVSKSTGAPRDLPEKMPDIPDDDGVVMTLFPRDTWSKVMEMSERANLKPGQIVSLALELLDGKIAKENEDGA